MTRRIIGFRFRPTPAVFSRYQKSMQKKSCMAIYTYIYIYIYIEREREREREWEIYRYTQSYIYIYIYTMETDGVSLYTIYAEVWLQIHKLYFQKTLELFNTYCKRGETQGCLWRSMFMLESIVGEHIVNSPYRYCCIPCHIVRHCTALRRIRP